MFESDEVPDAVTFSGFSARFDKYYGVFGPPKTDPIKLNIPNGIKNILAELRSRAEEPSSRHLAFLLLNMSSQILQAINDGFETIRKENPKPGMFKRITLNANGIAISVIASRNLPEKLLHDRTQFRALAEKYRLKANVGVAFGIELDSPEVFQSMFYAEGKWEVDPSMEQLLVDEPSSFFKKKSLPGRNDPCFCNSGKKFKKCCLNTIKTE
jgi:hypothetical protein